MSIIHEITKVVTPVDFSDNSQLIAESSIYLAGRFNASLHLVFVVQNFEDYSGFFVPQITLPSLEGELIESAEAKMVSFCSGLQDLCEKSGVKELNHKVFMGDVGEQIVQYAVDIDADMIVMGTHGYKGLEKIMFGSVADKVVRSASCPVLTINPYTCCD
ncbi:universal stress protein [Desulforhopalus singaporensis]|uniref:Universal stress protein n=1 Tax=Desulforhopalus singaporensis TaxID=91360 RepID=A0A1H0V5N6_9BACT|nr:universal stress protein [Desulforhopalus singaporensis]SDP73849.1 Nucleotide-binding universal stress protein, UspA family [Desulforhopalus singaporensis]